MAAAMRIVIARAIRKHRLHWLERKNAAIAPQRRHRFPIQCTKPPYPAKSRIWEQAQKQKSFGSFLQKRTRKSVFFF
jgi:hypothetical protein